MSAIMKLSEVLSEKDIAKMKPIIDYLETHDGISPQTANKKHSHNKSASSISLHFLIRIPGIVRPLLQTAYCEIQKAYSLVCYERFSKKYHNY